jgi:hypothetical protein
MSSLAVERVHKYQQSAYSTQPSQQQVVYGTTVHISPINSNVVWASLGHSRPPHAVHTHDMQTVLPNVHA